jgi:hypothetical protein
MAVEDVSSSMSPGVSVSTTVILSEMPPQSALQLEKDSIEHQKNAEVVQEINYLEEISNAVKEEKWEALDGLLNNVINSDMSVEELISITKEIQAFEVESEKRTYELGNNLNEVFKFSVEYDQAALVKVLIKIGFNANYGDTDSRQMNPMGYAVYFGNIKIVELMLSLGADINPCLCNPLLTAVTKNNFDMVKFLLGKGADPNRKCPGCDYPLHADSTC